jgi:hypothetical protein
MTNQIHAALGCLCLTAATSALARDFTLAQEGQPKATIVIAAAAGDKVKLAANELQRYVERISGARLPIVSDAEKPTGPLVLVGPSKLTENLKPPITSGLSPARREEGYVISCRDGRLVLAGNDQGPYHGTEYAVYDLLHRLGVRWYMPGDYGEIVPKLTTVSCREMAVSEKPDFIVRNWWLHALPELAEQEKRWKLRSRMNPDNLFTTPGDSSARNVLPEKQYFKEHPDYFALNPDGTRNPYLPNLANPKAVEIAAGIIGDYFRKNPEANSYGFAPDDGLPRDYSPDTLKLHQGFVDLLGRPGVAAEESTTEEWLTFVNQVTAKVRREFPEVYIATNGYANRNLPPEGVKLDDHLIIMFAAIWSCTLHAYDDPHCWQKVRQAEMLRRWCELCPNVWVYGYNYQMLVSGLTPLPETRKLRRDLPLMKKWGVIGFLDEARNVWAECGIASRYLRARLEWDADADADAILQEFYAQWYGAAAQPMQAFYDALEEAIEQSPWHGHEDRVVPFIYTPKLLATLGKHLAQAEKAADTEAARLHVRADRLIYDHLREYMAMSDAEAAADFAGAAQHAQKMMDLRKDLHAVNPFYVWFDETRYHSGVWYWGALDRKAYYESLADRLSGKTGSLVALCPTTAAFRTDPHDEGLPAQWYLPKLEEREWKPLSTTKPFYTQGYEDEQGYPYVGSMWYRMRVNVPASARGKKVILYAPVVETEAWCWVNGEYVGHRPYLEAYTRPCAMELDVTKALRPGQTNVIALRVSTGLAAAEAADGLLSRAFLYAPKGPLSP